MSLRSRVLEFFGFSATKPLSQSNIYEVAERHRKAAIEAEAKAVKRISSQYVEIRKSLQKEYDYWANRIGAATAAGVEPRTWWKGEKARIESLIAKTELEIQKWANAASVVAAQAQATGAKMGVANSQQLGTTVAEILKAARVEGGNTTGDFRGFRQLPRHMIEDLVGMAANGSPLYDLFKSIGADAASSARNTLADAVAQGWHPRKTRKRLASELEIPLNRALLIARTEQIRAMRLATQRTFIANSDVVAGWKWVASRNSRTCAVCLGMDGTTHPVTEVLSSHPACRCGMMPILKADLEDALGGAVEREPADEWLKKQPAGVRRHILGKTKAKWFDEGKISLRDIPRVVEHPRWGRGRVSLTLPELQVMIDGGTTTPLMGTVAPIVVPQAPLTKGSQNPPPKPKASQTTTEKAKKTEPKPKPTPKPEPAPAPPPPDPVEVEKSKLRRDAAVAGIKTPEDYGVDVSASSIMRESYLQKLVADHYLTHTPRQIAEAFYAHTSEASLEYTVQRVEYKVFAKKFDDPFAFDDGDQHVAYLLDKIAKGDLDAKLQDLDVAFQLLYRDEISDGSFKLIDAVKKAQGDLVPQGTENEIFYALRLGEKGVDLDKARRLYKFWGYTNDAAFDLAYAEGVQRAALVKAPPVAMPKATEGVKESDIAYLSRLAKENPTLTPKELIGAVSAAYPQTKLKLNEAAIAYAANHAIGIDPGASPTAPKPKAPKVKKIDDLTPIDAEEPIDAKAVVDRGTQVGAQAGSNEGGFYEFDGRKYYVKFYSDAAQAHGEALANKLYRELGIPAPQAEVEMVMRNGVAKYAYVSRVEQGRPMQTNYSGVALENISKEFAKGFVADVLLGNWDAVGATLDNVLVRPHPTIFGRFEVFRIDNGGSLLMRAKAGRKPTDLLEKITEWENFFDPSINPKYREMMVAGGYNSASDLRGEIAAGLKSVEAFLKRNGGRTGFENYVARVAPGLEWGDRRQIVKMLEKRFDKIKAEHKKLTAKPKRKGAPEGASIPDWRSSLAKIANEYRNAQWKAHSEAKARHDGRDDEFDALNTLMASWKGSATSAEPMAVYKVLERFGKTGKLEHDGTRAGQIALKAVQAIITSRRERWRRVADQRGLEMPTHFRAYRHDKDEHALRWVVAAWRDESSDMMRIRTRHLQCFTLSPTAARQFYGDSYGVRWEADVPFEQTFFDQIADDSSFVSSYFEEHEIAVGGFEENSIVTPKEKVKVRYMGKEYTYAERQDLFDAMTRRGETLPSINDDNFGESLFTASEAPKAGGMLRRNMTAKQEREARRWRAAYDKNQAAMEARGVLHPPKSLPVSKSFPELREDLEKAKSEGRSV